jgi:hypothetical protein
MTNRTVLGAQAGRIVIKLLALLQAPENVLNNLLVGVKRRYRLAYVFVCLIAEHLELCFIGSQNYAFRRHDMEADGGVFEKVLKIAVLIGTHESRFADLSGSLVNFRRELAGYEG